MLTNSPILLFLDRGYPSIDLIAQLPLLKINFLMRISAQSSRQEVSDFAATGQTATTIRLDVTTAKRKKNQCLQVILRQLDQTPLVVDLICLAITEGRKVYLISNLQVEQ